MGKGRRTFFVAVMVAAAAVMAWVLFKPGEPEPVYEGKPLSYWLQGFGPQRSKGSNGPPVVTWSEANKAFAALGTNAVPALMRLLQQKDSTLKTKIEDWLIRTHLTKGRNFSRNNDWKAAQALIWLGPAGSNAVPELIRMFERDHSAFTQSAVPVILGKIGRPAAMAAPVLLKRGITHTNAIVRANSIYAVRNIFPDANVAVPALINCLSDPDSVVLAQAACTLGRYGPEANEAVPQLTKLFKDARVRPPGAGWFTMEGACIISTWNSPPIFGGGSPDVQAVALAALRAIDHEAAEKAEAEQAVRSNKKKLGR